MIKLENGLPGVHSYKLQHRLNGPDVIAAQGSSEVLLLRKISGLSAVLRSKTMTSTFKWWFLILPLAQWQWSWESHGLVEDILEGVFA